MKLLILLTYLFSAIAIISSASLLISSRAGTAVFTPANDPVILQSQEEACNQMNGSWTCVLNQTTGQLDCNCLQN